MKLPPIDILVKKSDVTGYYQIAYVFGWDSQERYSREVLKQCWKLVKELAENDYGYFSSTIGSGVIVNVSEEHIKENHLVEACYTFDLSDKKITQSGDELL